ncbi:MAG: type II toxin-antitoxin system VapC family toxin [Anaerolineae bacterium]|nr:type II toxin-antitoxin system VapC family toxin [Anaerolineae bacterium]
MKSVFVDTAAWIALFNEYDALHNQASRLKLKLNVEHTWLVTTDFVLLEVADALCAARARSRTITNVNTVRQSPTTVVVPFSQVLLNAAWNMYSRRLDKDWSLTDCTSFVVMTQEGITQAFTSDHHFEQAGFKKLL